MWSNEDPRNVLIDRKRASIIVSDGTWAFAAQVEMKHGWYVELGGCIRGWRGIGEHDKWPPELQWTELPEPTGSLAGVEKR